MDKVPLARYASFGLADLARAWRHALPSVV